MKRLALSLLTLLAAASVSAAQLIIPAAGALPGANGSQWQSDLSVHNLSTHPAMITIAFHDGSGQVETRELTVLSRQTIALENIVGDYFGLSNVNGSLVITGDEFVLRKLSVTSRTYNLSDEGEFGQDIPALTATSAAIAGDTAVINGPIDAASTRFNFGVYAVEDTEIDWILVREDGASAATVTETYEAGSHIQYNQGIPTFLGEENLSNDVVYARIIEGRAFLYGSIVSNATGDPSFVPSIASRENYPAQLLGVDLNEDGVVDIFDENGDGILDGEVKLGTIGFPNFFRIIAIDPEGNDVELELVDASNEVRIFTDGTVQWAPNNGLRGTAGVLKVKASDGFAATEFLIPVLFR